MKYTETFTAFVRFIRGIENDYSAEKNVDGYMNEFRQAYRERFDWHKPYASSPADFMREFALPMEFNGTHVIVEGSFKKNLHGPDTHIDTLIVRIPKEEFEIDSGEMKSRDRDTLFWLIEYIKPDPTYLIPYAEVQPRWEQAESDENLEFMNSGPVGMEYREKPQRPLQEQYRVYNPELQTEN